VIILTSPNNPTGSALPEGAVERVLADTDALVLCDEAYQDFGGPSALGVMAGDDRVIVLSGVKAGEKIVTSGNFLIDSESTLKSALSGMGMPGMDHAKPSGGTFEQKPSDTSSPQPPAMDHSQRDKADKPSVKEGPMDHSKHQKMPEQNNHD